MKAVGGRLLRPRMSSGLRRLMKRDRGRCHLCGYGVTREQATRDHVVPRSAGGRSSRNNLALAHADCNNARGTRPVATRVTKRGWR